MEEEDVFRCLLREGKDKDGNKYLTLFSNTYRASELSWSISVMVTALDAQEMTLHGLPASDTHFSIGFVAAPEEFSSSGGITRI
jgi:hypothetical protein